MRTPPRTSWGCRWPVPLPPPRGAGQAGGSRDRAGQPTAPRHKRRHRAGLWPMERLGVRKRLLSPGFFQDGSLAACSPLALLLFAGLWALCDRDGRMRWVPPVVHGQLFPFDPDAAVEALVTELAAAGCVVLYAVEGRRYLACPSGPQHQNPHKNERASDIPAPPEPSVPSRVSHWSKSSQPLVEATRSLPESESESESVPPKPPIAHPPHRPPAAAAFDEEPRTDPLDLHHRLTPP